MTPVFFNDTSGEAICEILSAALSPYFRPVRSKGKCRKAARRVADSLASDADWILLKNNSAALAEDGILRAFFGETDAALLLDAVLNPRPAYLKESGRQCYAHWIEACNPLETADETDGVFRISFNIVFGHFKTIKKYFNAAELQLIYKEVENRINSSYAAADRTDAAPGSFLEYIRNLPKAKTWGRPAGRGRELLELKKFCYSDRRLLWWSVSGRSGAGKTRLAAELCRAVAEERSLWRCVFLTPDFFANEGRFGANWALDKNLLAVVDSPNYYIEKTALWIKQLIESDTLNRKIRILILEREGAGDTEEREELTSASRKHGEQASAFRERGEPVWFAKLKMIAGENVLSNLCYDRDCKSLELGGLGDSDCLDIITEYFESMRTPMPARAQTQTPYWGGVIPPAETPAPARAQTQTPSRGGVIPPAETPTPARAQTQTPMPARSSRGGVIPPAEMPAPARAQTHAPAGADILAFWKKIDAGASNLHILRLILMAAGETRRYTEFADLAGLLSAVYEIAVSRILLVILSSGGTMADRTTSGETLQFTGHRDTNDGQCVGRGFPDAPTENLNVLTSARQGCRALQHGFPVAVNCNGETAPDAASAASTTFAASTASTASNASAVSTDFAASAVSAASDAYWDGNPIVIAVMRALAFAALISKNGLKKELAGRICAMTGIGENGPGILTVANIVNTICGDARPNARTGASGTHADTAGMLADTAGTYADVTGAFAGADGSSALCPDLFRWYFAVRTLGVFGRGGIDKKIVSLAWGRFAYEAANFFHRMADDCVENKLYVLAPEIANYIYEAPIIAEAAGAALFGELMVHMTACGSALAGGPGGAATRGGTPSGSPGGVSAARMADAMDEAAARLETLRSRGYARDRNIALRLSQVLFNMTSVQEAEGIERTAARIEGLRGQGFAKDREIALRLCKTLMNLELKQACARGKETVARMEELRGQGFEQDRDITLILAQSLFILTAKQDEEGIKNTVARIEALRNQGFERDRDITLELIKALLNLTTKQDEAGRRETVARIEALRDMGFAQDREITLELVKALLNLTIKQDEAGIAESVRRIDELRGEGFSRDKDITLALAQALLNLTTKQEAPEMQMTVARLEELRNQGFEADRDITLELAAALFNLTTRQDENGIKASVERLEELRNSGFAGDREITLRLAQALFSLTTKHGAAGRAEAAARIGELRGQGLGQDREMTLTLVKALYNLTIELDAEGTKGIVARIEEICSQGYAQDKDIRLLFAKSLFNLTTKLDEQGIEETVSRLETLRR